MKFYQFLLLTKKKTVTIVYCVAIFAFYNFKPMYKIVLWLSLVCHISFTEVAKMSISEPIKSPFNWPKIN